MWGCGRVARTRAAIAVGVLHLFPLVQQRSDGGGNAQGACEDHGTQDGDVESSLRDSPEKRGPQDLADEGSGHEEERQGRLPRFQVPPKAEHGEQRQI